MRPKVKWTDFVWMGLAVPLLLLYMILEGLLAVVQWVQSQAARPIDWIANRLEWTGTSDEQFRLWNDPIDK